MDDKRSINFTFRIDTETHDELKEMASALDRHAGWVLRKIIRHARYTCFHEPTGDTGKIVVDLPNAEEFGLLG